MSLGLRSRTRLHVGRPLALPLSALSLILPTASIVERSAPHSRTTHEQPLQNSARRRRLEAFVQKTAETVGGHASRARRCSIRRVAPRAVAVSGRGHALYLRAGLPLPLRRVRRSGLRHRE